MRAIRVHQFGGPEALMAEEIDAPAPAPGQALVRVELALPFKYVYASVAACFCLWIVWAITGYERTPAHEPRVP